MGMAHRGRLNVLVNLLQKPLDVVCSEFDGSSKYSIGDVRYHLGTRSHVSDNFTVDLVANPSHLEMVFPVVVGKTRAAQHYLADTEATKRVMPLLIHGDAAFSAQGIVAETMELSDLKQYTVGGSAHVIVNNRIGYTTNTREARSSPWCTNMAKGVFYFSSRYA
jgi:2-oxoglutarate dehydrogenase complex dehydrogenase (E1) component-like enzyme